MPIIGLLANLGQTVHRADTNALLDSDSIEFLIAQIDGVGLPCALCNHSIHAIGLQHR